MEKFWVGEELCFVREEAIREALECLRGISVTKSYRRDLDRAIRILEVELE